MQDKESYLDARRKELETCATAISRLRGDRAGSNTANAVEGALGSALRALEEKMRQASEGLNSLKAATAENWESLKEVADRSFQELKESLKHIAEEANRSPIIHTVTDCMKSAEKCIQKNPLGTALAALGLGFILGRMFKS